MTTAKDMMTLEPKNIVQDCFRFDKNIANNIDNPYFANAKGSGDGSLLRCLIYFFAHNYKHNFFNFGILNPSEFAKDFQFSEGFLRTRHPQPAQLDLATEEEKENYLQLQRESEELTYRIWDSNLENALWVLANRAYSVERGEYTIREGNVTKSLSTMLIVTSLEAVKTGRGNKKIVYRYTLNPAFTETLSRYYLTANKKPLVQLKASNLDALYLMLLNLKTNLALNGVFVTTADKTPSFSWLCDLAGIRKIKRDGQPYEPKYMKRDLIKALDIVRNTADFKFSFSCTTIKGHRWAYVFLFEFEDVAQGSMRIASYNDRKELYCEHLLRQLIEVWGRVSATDDFYKWLTCDEAKEEKITAYRNAQIRTFEKVHAKIELFAERFYKTCLNPKIVDQESFFAAFSNIDQI